MSNLLLRRLSRTRRLPMLREFFAYLYAAWIMLRELWNYEPDPYGEAYDDPVDFWLWGNVTIGH
jgi:hypothetical protein